MGMRITSEQNEAAAQDCVERIDKRFGGSGITTTLEHHSNAHKLAFVRITAPPQHWSALAKWLRFDLGVNHCSMVTGTHYPEGGAERGWEVAYHLMRQPVKDQRPHTHTVHVAESLTGDDVPMHFEVLIP